jgi:shikimate kinase
LGSTPEDLLTARIALIGLSGAGKSTVAPLLAQRLGFGWTDLDEAIAGAEGAPVAAILTSRGEGVFRELEADALRAALAEGDASPGTVVACGAGVLGRAENRAVLREGAFVVWLAVTPETAARRLEGAGAATRPLLSGKPVEARLRELWEARRVLYEEAADAAVETDGLTPAGVVDVVLGVWKGRRAWGSSGS